MRMNKNIFGKFKLGSYLTIIIIVAMVSSCFLNVSAVSNDKEHFCFKDDFYTGVFYVEQTGFTDNVTIAVDGSDFSGYYGFYYFWGTASNGRIYGYFDDGFAAWIVNGKYVMNDDTYILWKIPGLELSGNCYFDVEVF